MHNDKYMSVKPKIIPNVLLLGNGINRAYEASSWDDIISSLSKGEYDSKSKWAREIQKLPNSLQTIVISNDSVHDGMKQVSKKLILLLTEPPEQRAPCIASFFLPSPSVSQTISTGAASLWRILPRGSPLLIPGGGTS